METIIYTDHARRRMNQRGISANVVRLALQHGTCFHRQGYRFYVVRRKDVPDGISTRWQDRLCNLAVVVSRAPDGGAVVVTAYRSDKAPGRIRRKPKRLSC